MKLNTTLPPVEDLKQEFFASLKGDYKGFENWYQKVLKEDRNCFVIKNEDDIIAITILKIEESKLKICTFKVDENYKGNMLGEILLKCVFDFAIKNNLNEIYTEIISEKRDDLISFLGKKWGFDLTDVEWKPDLRRTEARLIKKLNGSKIKKKREIFPKFVLQNYSKVLTIKHDFHDKLFLKNKTNITDIDVGENPQLLTITKVYSTNGAFNFKKGEQLFVYRTNDKENNARGKITDFVIISNILHKGKDYNTLEKFKKITQKKNGFLVESDYQEWFKNESLLILKHITALPNTKNYGLNLLEIGDQYPHNAKIENTAEILKELEINESLIVNTSKIHK